MRSPLADEGTGEDRRTERRQMCKRDVFVTLNLKDVRCVSPLKFAYCLKWLFFTVVCNILVEAARIRLRFALRRLSRRQTGHMQEW